MELTLCKREAALAPCGRSGHADLIGIEYQFTPGGGGARRREMRRYLYYGKVRRPYAWVMGGKNRSAVGGTPCLRRELAHSGRRDPVPRLPAMLFQQPHIPHHHAPIYRLAHSAHGYERWHERFVNQGVMKVCVFDLDQVR